MRALLICLLLFVFFCVVMAIRGGGPSGGSVAPIIDGEQSHASAVRPEDVSALTLSTDYLRNEVAADNLYKGHLLAVHGMVTSINKDIFDKIYVSLATPNEFMNVQAHLAAGSESQAAALQRGETITVVCTGNGMVLGSPMLRDCSFAKPEKDSDNRGTASSSPAVLAPQQSIQESEAATNGEAAPAQQVGDAVEVPRKIGGAVSAPELLAAPLPDFPEGAREAKIGANVLVHTWVGVDGRPSHVEAIRTVYIDHDGHASAGPNTEGSSLGFEEKAVEAVKKYNFRPARENGLPVLVEVNVDVKFVLDN